MSGVNTAGSELPRQTIATTIAHQLPSSSHLSPTRDKRPAPLPPVIRATLAYRPAEIGISVDEWHAFIASQSNVLLIGSDKVLASVWTGAWPALRKPVCWTDSVNFWLPHESVPTLVLQDIDDLNGRDQARLLAWLQRDAHVTRVLATTRRPLFPRVQEGAFFETLYYCLNTLLLTLESPLPTGSTSLVR
jgi:hypothetical protein